MRISRYFFSTIFCLFSAWALAQEVSDSLRKPPKEPIDWQPSMLRVGFDVAGMGMALATSDRSRTEGMIEMDLGNWFIVSENLKLSIQV